MTGKNKEFLFFYDLKGLELSPRILVIRNINGYSESGWLSVKRTISPLVYLMNGEWVLQLY
jgi:hypothetical protein